jgi:hypothetical protein
MALGRILEHQPDAASPQQGKSSPAVVDGVV